MEYFWNENGYMIEARDWFQTRNTIVRSTVYRDRLDFLTELYFWKSRIEIARRIISVEWKRRVRELRAVNPYFRYAMINGILKDIRQCLSGLGNDVYRYSEVLFGLTRDESLSFDLTDGVSTFALIVDRCVRELDRISNIKV